MQTNNPLLVPELREILSTGDVKSLRDFCESAHPAVVADSVSALPWDEAWAVLNLLNASTRATVFSHLDGGFQVEIVESLDRLEVAHLLTEMPPDDRADLFKHLPRQLGESILPALAQAEREDIRRLASYEEGTAGAAMTSDYATVSPGLTAVEAVDRLRQVAPDKETIYYAYVLDERRTLLGFVSLKDLIVAKREAKVEEIMHRDVIAARIDEDQEEAVRKIQKYDLLALPVVDTNNSLMGIITHDDAIDIITQEYTEDMEKFMAIAGSHVETMYLKTSTLGHFKNRYPWIVALAMLGLVSGYIIQNFEGLLIQFAILAAFMPMMADTGGNTGSQSATLVVRALALREVATKGRVPRRGPGIRCRIAVGSVTRSNRVCTGSGFWRRIDFPRRILFDMDWIRHRTGPGTAGSDRDIDWRHSATGRSHAESGPGRDRKPGVDHYCRYNRVADILFNSQTGPWDLKRQVAQVMLWAKLGMSFVR